jgi:hypothetical protein
VTRRLSGGRFSQRARSLPKSAPATVQAMEEVIRARCRDASVRIATELHALLRNDGEQPTLCARLTILWWLNVRVFDGLYPTEVAGIVLADATQEDQYELFPKAWNVISAAQLKFFSFLSPVFLCPVDR